MMLEKISRELALDMDLIPVASFDRDVDQLMALGIEFVREEDDLDIYDLAAFHSSEIGVFAFLCYLSKKNTALLLRNSASFDVEFVVNSVAQEFQLPVSIFHWRINGEDASISAKDRPEICPAG